MFYEQIFIIISSIIYASTNDDNFSPTDYFLNLKNLHKSEMKLSDTILATRDIDLIGYLEHGSIKGDKHLTKIGVEQIKLQ
jgi:hypothetical protein